MTTSDASSPAGHATAPTAPRAPGVGLDAVVESWEAGRRSRRTVLGSSADRVARQVRAEVADGRLSCGTKLPETRLAAALGVSRNTLREALGQLVAERLLVREEHRGVVVATPGPAEVLDVYAARLVLEPGALHRAHGAGPDALAALRAAVHQGRLAHDRGDHQGLGTANQHFHRSVVALAGSHRLDAQMDLLLAEVRLVFQQVQDPERFHTPYLVDNERICDLVEAGDLTAAARELQAYLERARDELLGAVGR